MNDSLFVPAGSIVRRIWGDADLVLLVFAGAASEFALNRAVDWLFFTGKIPQDPLGRLFSTAAYAQQIVMADQAGAERTLARIRAAHGAVEGARGARIPDWAHRDVLYLLVAYSEAAYETLHPPLTLLEREELWSVFRRVGLGLGIPELPVNYAGWQEDRERHLQRDLACGAHTRALYAAYRQHLGPWRYLLLRQVQGVLVPGHVRALLGLPKTPWLRGLLPLYPLATRLGLRATLRRTLIPPAHLASVQNLDLASP
ncbi:DUF2236 domain-containing protein (plasmid) [Deinococcus sp. QL22]|nr:oxygenase MpaB family protein [Deinococcus sp. QL22]UQN09020.1 DUF2236 domain-containing protein [Deinococcus sp. QL22]